MTNPKLSTLADALAKLQNELLQVNCMLLTAAGVEHTMLEEWALAVRRRIAALSGEK